MLRRRMSGGGSMPKVRQRRGAEVLALAAAAEAHCLRQGAAWTDNRRFLFLLLARADRPLKAYDLIPRLRAARRPSNPASVYRVLAFLEAAGLVARIETLNAYAALPQPGRRAGFLVCRSCEGAAPIERCACPDPPATTAAFTVEDWIFEVRGLCAGCAADPVPPHSSRAIR